MKFLDIKRLSHRFVDRDDDGNEIGSKMAVDDLSLEVNEGDFIAVLGHNGSGKSTFAKHLNALLLPSEGTVYVGGMDTKDASKVWDIRQNTGMVFQNPDNQIIATVVEDDIGFGPENLGIETEDIWKRVEKALEAVHMTEYRKHSPNMLSGGQKQRVAIAGVLAMKPKCIVLDEPTAMLDPTGRKEVIETITELNKKENVTIILVTHFMEEVVYADKVFVMDDGKLALSGTPKEVFSEIEKLMELGLDVPDVTNIAYKLENYGINLNRGILHIDELCETLLKVREKNKAEKIKNDMMGDNETEKKKNNMMGDNEEKNVDIIGYIESNSIDMTRNIESDNMDIPYDNNRNDSAESKKTIIEVKNITHIYGKDTNYERIALDDVSFKIYQGEIIGIIGHTGSGKSTIVQHLNGLLKPDSGQIIFNGKNIFDKDIKINEIRRRVGLVFQYPEYQLFESSVLKDVCFGPINMGMKKEEAIISAKKSLSLMGIDECMYERSPFELSGGEKRRVAIAGVLAMEPEVIILDEPTAGLDPRKKKELLELLLKMKKERNITIVIVSHSMEDMAKYAERIVVMNKGKVMYDDTPESVFDNCDELEKIGLAAPQVVYVLKKLVNCGFKFDEISLDIEKASRMIAKEVRKSK